MKRGFITFGILAFSIILIITSFAHATVVANSTNSTNVSNSTSQTNISTNETIKPIFVAKNQSNGIDNETQNQIRIMQDYGIGAKIRVLELQRSLEVKILEAQAVLNYIKTNKSSADTSNLSNILNQMQSLKASITNVSVTNKTAAVQQFVDTKIQAKTLVQEFRLNASKYLNNSDREALRAQFNSIEKNSFKELRLQIQSLQKQLWMEQVQSVLDRIGKRDQNLLNRINSSNFTAREIRAKLNEDYRNLSIKERINAQVKLREDAIKAEQARLGTLRDLQKNLTQRVRLQREEIQKMIQRERPNFTNGTNAPVRGLRRLN